MPVRVCGPRGPSPRGVYYINTTSRDIGPFKGLSPFFLGPVELYYGITSRNVENAWQFSKVYPEHTDEKGDPTDKWAGWAIKGFNEKKAYRYPMGKGRKPLYSFWAGKKLDYIAARKEIYCPLYSEAVYMTPAWKMLYKEYTKFQMGGGTLWLWDFDGYDHVRLGMSYEDVLNDPTRKMGHAFVLAMMLEGQRVWER